jgi:Fe2+ or Zn2+ uptake regulation protein
MKDYRNGKHWIECDQCNETECSEKGETWAELWGRMKSAGWKAEKVGAEFVHACPRCEL